MADSDKKCIIVGLPNAGKSTYIGAFWAIEKDGNTGHKLQCVKYPSETQHVDKLKRNWQSQIAVDHTTFSSLQNLEFELKELDSDRTLLLTIPDFKGELFQNILLNNVTKEVTEWLEKADCMLFFMEYAEQDVLQEQIGANPDDKSSKMSVMKMNDISLWTRNIMLLKYILENYGSPKIAICISAWDKAGRDDVCKWIEETSPFFYNFVVSHFSDVKFYGVSAQGVDYTDLTDDKRIDLQEKTEKHERAYVCDNNKSYDITLPLHYLLSK